MNIDPTLRAQIETMFAPLNTVPAAKAFPAAGALSQTLADQLAGLPDTSPQLIPLGPVTASLFATAAIDVWLRGVHSFLISASLTNASPIWSSVSGYYSSHYSVRAIAHILGVFQLFAKKRTAQIVLDQGHHLCSFEKKQGNDREHRFYWKVVKRSPLFSGDAIFAENSDPGLSDVSHRDRANYADNLGPCPAFKELSRKGVKDRVRHISQIEVSGIKIPCRDSYPDIQAVQILAYHRMVRFRTLVDEVLGGANRFWGVHREPGWALGLLDFQLAATRGLGGLGDSL